MKKVLCFGTFDILHPGHIYFLKECKKLGDFLVVVVARDLTVKKVKGRWPKNDEKSRKQSLVKLETGKIKKTKIANQVILGKKDDPYKIIEKIRPDIICLGYDQKTFTEDLKLKLARRGIDCEVSRIGAFKPEKYKSSKLSTHFDLTKKSKSDKVEIS